MRRSIWSGGRPWYELLLMLAASLTIAVSLVYASGAGRVFLGIERRLIEALLEAQGIGVYTVTYNTFIAYTESSVATLKIVPSCSSLYPITAFAVIGLILPGIPLRSRVEAVILYPPILFMLNIVRVTAVASIGLRLGTAELQVLHDYLGTIVGILSFGLLWIHWFNRAVKPLTPISQGAPATAVMAILVSIALLGAPAQAAPAQVVVLATDEPDLRYIEDWSERSGIAPALVSLEDLAGGPPQGILVLLDPNYDPGQIGLVEDVVEAVEAGLERGTPVIVSLNGVSMLRLGGLLEDFKISCPPGGEPLPGYDTETYCVAEAPPYVDTVDLGGPRLYVQPAGSSVIVVVPYNIVWAYNSTSHPAYLDILTEALSIAQAYKPPSGFPIALLALLAALAGAATQVRGREEAGSNGSPAAGILGYKRVGGEEVWNNPVRRRIVEVLSEEPIHFNELWRRLGVAKATLSWHLSVLEREGIVSVLRYKRYKIVYLAGDEDSVLRMLARERLQDLCIIAETISRGGDLRDAARRLRTRPESVRQVYTLVESNLEEVLSWCPGLGVL